MHYIILSNRQFQLFLYFMPYLILGQHLFVVILVTYLKLKLYKVIGSNNLRNILLFILSKSFELY